MTRNNHVVRPLTLGVALLLYVVLLPGTGIVSLQTLAQFLITSPYPETKAFIYSNVRKAK